MPGAAVTVALTIGLALVLLFVLRVAYRLQEVFQQICRIKRSIGLPASADDYPPDRNLVVYDRLVMSRLTDAPTILEDNAQLSDPLEEIFQRLGLIEKSVGRHTNDYEDDALLSKNSQSENDKHCKLDEKLTDELLSIAQRKVRRHTWFYGFARLWAFLMPARVAHLAPRQISAIDILRSAQRVISNPYRWCDYALATDRWGRTVNVCRGHAFSDIGVFWHVVNGLEVQGYKFENAFLDSVEALVLFTGHMLNRTKGGYYHGSVLAVAQYELAIRACRDKLATLNSISAVLSSESDPGKLLLRNLRHTVLHRGGSPNAT